MSSELSPQSEIILYQTEDGGTRLRVRLQDETVWLTQKLMAELFDKDVRTINEHIRNIFEEGELAEESVIRKFRITAADGKSYATQHYNLDVIISVGYRAKSLRGTQFLIWATQRLREYVVKGFTMDDERLKQSGGGAYFDELLERIRDIRSSEKVFWRKVRLPNKNRPGRSRLFLLKWVRRSWRRPCERPEFKLQFALPSRAR